MAEAEEMSSSSSSNVKVAGSVDIMSDILSRLPVETLLRFRSVSKPWCSLIDSSDFATLHLNRSVHTKSNLSLILFNRDLGWMYSIDFDKLDQALELHNPLKESIVLASCNGLLLLEGFSFKPNSLALYNPVTRKHKVIPVCPFYIDYIFRGIPKGGPCGLGYDAVNDDYKIISILEYVDEGSGKWIASDTKIYSLNSDEWKPMKDFPFKGPSCMREWGVHMKGAMHTLVKRNGNVDDPKCEDAILVTDLSKEDYRYMGLPSIGHNAVKLLLYVLGVEECLCLQIIYRSGWTDFWVMKEYGVTSSWTKLFEMPPFPCLEYLDVVSYSKECDKVLYVADDMEFCWYDLNQKRVIDIPVKDLPKPVFNVQVCVKSLVRPDGLGKCKKYQPTTWWKSVKEKQKQTNRKRDGFLSQGFKLKL